MDTDKHAEGIIATAQDVDKNGIVLKLPGLSSQAVSVRLITVFPVRVPCIYQCTIKETITAKQVNKRATDTLNRTVWLRRPQELQQWDKIRNRVRAQTTKRNDVIVLLLHAHGAQGIMYSQPNTPGRLRSLPRYAAMRGRARTAKKCLSNALYWAKVSAGDLFSKAARTSVVNSRASNNTMSAYLSLSKKHVQVMSRLQSSYKSRR